MASAPCAGDATTSADPGSGPSTAAYISSPACMTQRSLQRLPNELLRPIAAFLVPSPPSTTRFFLRAIGTWTLKDAASQEHEWRTSHINILSFAQTSRRMAAAALPLLYCTVVVRSAKSLVTLALRLQQRPEIRNWICYLSCLLNLLGRLSSRNVYQEWERQTGDRLEGHEGFLSITLFSDIISQLPNLQDFLVAFPDQNQPFTEEYEDDLPLPFARALVVENIYESPRPLADSPILPFQGLLNNLTSLRVYCHREDRDRCNTWAALFVHYTLGKLSDLHQLRTLEICCDSIIPMGNNGHTVIPPLPQIHHLRLYGSFITEPELVELVNACKTLQSLLVHFEVPCNDDRDRDLLPDRKTLNQVLLDRADTLASLELVALSEGHYLTRGRERPRKPENHRLTCFPQLTRLESLTIDYRGLFGTLGIFEYDDGERLCRMLPPALKHFTLVCEFGTVKDTRQIYLANLDMMIYGVECLSKAPAPRLSTISLAIHPWPFDNHRFRNRFHRQIEMANQQCRAAGIRFRTHDLFPSYQDEDESNEVPDDDHEGMVDDEWIDMTPSREYENVGVIETALAPAGPLPNGLEGADDVYEEEYLELEEEDEASEYYSSGSEEDPEREARRPASFSEFCRLLGEDHGHSFDELYYAWWEDRWDEYLF